MKKLLLLCTIFGCLFIGPIFASTEKTEPIDVPAIQGSGITITAQAPTANPASASFLAIFILVVLASIYVARKGITRYKNTLIQYSGGKTADDPIVPLLELIETILNILFPAITAVLLVLHLNGVIPYISIAEEISGIVLAAAIAIVELIEAFLKAKSK
jgi:hypothetical protein